LDPFVVKAGTKRVERMLQHGERVSSGRDRGDVIGACGDDTIEQHPFVVAIMVSKSIFAADDLQAGGSLSPDAVIGCMASVGRMPGMVAVGGLPAKPCASAPARSRWTTYAAASATATMIVAAATDRVVRRWATVRLRQL